MLLARPVVYIVDDDEIILWLFQEMLQQTGAVFRTFNTARAFLDSYIPGPCECPASDLPMPEIGGLEVQRELVAAGNCLPIIFASGHTEVPTVVEAMKVGAFDFLEKPVDGARLLEKVRSALAHSLTLHDQRVTRAARLDRLSQLTPKEREIAGQVVTGKSSREISAELGLSVRTVENHRARVMEKLHVGSTVELVRLLCE